MKPQQKPFEVAMRILGSTPVHWLSRFAAVGMVAVTTLHGASLGTPPEDLARIPGRLASVLGLAADDIRIAGLVQHAPSELLLALNIKPGAPLLGFDSGRARRTLEAMPWVREASVAREYPNMLRITVAERKAIAVWQHDNKVELVDAYGVAMGPADEQAAKGLVVLTGEGAASAAPELVNQLAAIPGLSEKVSAVARVGQRRWTLYLNSGVKLAMPEEGLTEALKTAWELDQSQGLFSKNLGVIDLRQKGKLVLEMANAGK